MLATKSLLRQSAAVARASSATRPSVAATTSTAARSFSSSSRVERASPVEGEAGSSKVKEFQIYRWVSDPREGKLLRPKD